MKPKLNPHLIPQHWGQFDEDMLRDWQPESAKVVWVGMPAHIDSILRLNPKFIIIRDYELADAGQQGITTVEQAIRRGREHADAHRQLAEKIEQQFGYPRSKILFEGWNEPPIWQGEFYKLVDAYETMRMTAVSGWGGRCAVGNFNTGHPDNSGPDTDPNWFWFPLMKNVLEQSRRRHGLALHEYMSFVGPEAKRPNGIGGWSWDMGRYTRNHWNCDIYLTEVGVDEAVYQGGHKGWMELPLPDMESRARTYTQWLLWYAERLAKDERVKGAYIFTHDSQSRDWLSFDTRNASFWETFIPAYHAADFPEPTLPPVDTLPDFIKDVVDALPKHPTKHYTTRLLSKVKRIVLHHTASWRDTTTPEAIARYHVNTHGWPGSAYHVVIDGAGQAYLVNRLETDAAGATGFNTDSVHLTFTGFFTDFGKERPSDAQIATGKKVLAWLYQRLNLGPEHVTGHKNLPGHSTECPGSGVMQDWWRTLVVTAEIPVAEVVFHAEQAARDARDGKGQQAHDRLVALVLPYLIKQRDA